MGSRAPCTSCLVIPETGLAYVPIFGDGIHGRNPNPGHLLCIIDLVNRRHVGDIDLRPYIAPHTLRLGPDGLIYITCENSAVVAVINRTTQTVIDVIDSGSTNGHRLVISPDGRRLYTENEEDGTVSMIDLPNRKLLGKVKTPRPLAGIAMSADGRTVVAVDDEQPTLFLIGRAVRSNGLGARNRDHRLVCIHAGGQLGETLCGEVSYAR
jgi:DNA-binding beta-propeller fold protein YncE